MKITYRVWKKSDACSIRLILSETWKETYASFIPTNDLFGYLDEYYNVDAIENSLSNPNIVGIIAEVDNQPAGSIRMHYNDEERRLYVQQLYILPQFQRLGIGRILMEFSAVRAKLLGLDRVWIGVMVKNESAVSWYKKLGYEITETTPFIMGKTNVDHYIGYVPIDRINLSSEISNLPNPLLRKVKLIYDSHHPEGMLPKYCCDLLEQQKKEWKQLAEGHLALKSVRTKEIVCSNFSAKLQFNPKRIASTIADTDPAAISKRKCFLCLENLPNEQKGILYANEYLILCNPAPIFSAHFTIINIQHIPQDFIKSAEALLDLAKDLSPNFTIFYNGPKGGASAPDHLHFQVTPRRALQVENDAVDMHRRHKFYYKDHVAGFNLKDYGRAVFILESTNKEKLFNFLLKLIDVWKSILKIKEEPIMNVLCSFQEDIWRVIIFPRTKHRPNIYFKQGEERIVVSPAAVDIGGLIVLPLGKDFQRMDANIIESIFTEVSEQREIVEQIIREMQ